MHANLCSILRKRGIDVEHAQELGRKGRTDAEQLQCAVGEKRCLITFNVKHFVLLHNEYINTDREHWGIIVAKQLPIGEALRRVLRVQQSYSQDSMKNRLLLL